MKEKKTKRKKVPNKSKASWIGLLAYLLITGIHAWYLHGFVPTGGWIFLSFIGGILVYFGLKNIALLLFKGDFNPWYLAGGLLLLGLGAMTLLPGWPKEMLTQIPGGWQLLDNRARLLDRALYDENEPLIRKIARAGFGDLEPRDSFGHPLINDAKDPEILNVLLDADLNPDARDEGGTTLLMSTYDENIARVLLEAGADPNARDDEGRTPLMHVRNGNIPFLRLLLENGADPNAVDHFNKTVGDLIGDTPEIESLFAPFAPGGIRRSDDLDFLSHARRDWLDQENLQDDTYLKPSEIQADPETMTFGDVAELSIRLSNDTNVDRVLKVEAGLNVEALFVDASHDGKIINPHQAQVDQEVGWPQLALPAYSSGVLNMRILVRDDWDAGDLTVDVVANNALTYNEDEAIHLNHYHPLSEQAFAGGSLSSMLVWFLIIPLPFVIWFGAVRVLGTKHTFTRLAGRLVAGIFSLLLFLGAYSMTMDLLRPFLHFEETEALIMDRRFHLESSTTSSSSGGSSRTTIHQIPIVAAQYNALGSEVISSGKASLAFFRNHKLGEVVPAWYDPDNPSEFTVVREINLFVVFGIFLVGSLSLVLIWIATRQRDALNVQ